MMLHLSLGYVARCCRVGEECPAVECPDCVIPTGSHVGDDDVFVELWFELPISRVSI